MSRVDKEINPPVEQVHQQYGMLNCIVYREVKTKQVTCLFGKENIQPLQYSRNFCIGQALRFICQYRFGRKMTEQRSNQRLHTLCSDSSLKNSKILPTSLSPTQ